jgi:aminoglycoside phosphotransferase (APT) family kinase protein
MPTELDQRVKKWITGSLHGEARLRWAHHIPGGTSARLDAVDVLLDGKRVQLVLRRFTDKEWLAVEPDLVAHEAAALAWASYANLRVPTLVAFDSDGEDSGTPATLTTMLPGKPQLRPDDLADWLAEMAAAAFEIHQLDADGFPWTYRRFNAGVDLDVPRWSRKPDAWRKAIDIVHAEPPSARECFIHRDFHPSNLLWQDSKVSGVVDWVNACKGPVGIDIAWCRHNLANLYSVEVADEFLEAYSRVAGLDYMYDPYWDVMTAVELLPGPPTMYAGWVAEGFPFISTDVLAERLDQYVASITDRL